MYTMQTYTTEPSPRRVRTYFNGEAVADSKNMVLFFEPPYPAYYFPKKDVRMDLLDESAKRIGNDPRGEKVFWNLKVGDRKGRERRVYVPQSAEFRSGGPRRIPHLQLANDGQLV